MDNSIRLQNRTVTVRISPAAEKALARRQVPLLAEMELYFSCLIRKKVRFRDVRNDSEGVWIGDKLKVHFRPVMTAHCATDYVGEEPPLTDFPLSRSEAFTPTWLQLDIRQGEWYGEFGFESGSK